MGLQLHKAGLEALPKGSGSRAASQAGVHVGVVMFDLEVSIILDPCREVQIPSCSTPSNLSRSPGRHRKATIASAATNSLVAKQRLSAVCGDLFGGNKAGLWLVGTPSGDPAYQPCAGEV